MKRLLVFFILLLGTQQVSASCGFYYAAIGPFGEDLSQNPIILLDYNKGYQKAFENAKFYLLTDNGRKIALEIIEENIIKENSSVSSSAQKVLKSTEILDIGTTVTLNVENLSTNYLHDSFRGMLIRRLSRTWTVNIEEDKFAPWHNGEISGVYDDYLISSTSGVSLKINLPYKDNTELDKNRERKQILVEVTNNDGYKYILFVANGNFSLHNNTCRINYKLEPDTLYEFEFRLMDYSGNKSKKAKKFTYKTDISSVVKWKQKEDEIYRRWEEEQAKKKN